MSESAYLAIDPGETTGWATFDADGNGLSLGQFKQKDQTEQLTELLHSGLKAVIVEDYRNYAFKGGQTQKRWSRNQTSKNIGAIEMLAELRGVPVILQGAQVKSIGYKWCGLGGPPSNHAISHQYDAYVHGVYYLQSNNIVPVGHYIKDKL